MTKTIIHFLLRLLVGATFIFSGASKLLFIEPFELSFVELGFGWYITPFLARFLIASEFILGLALIFNVKTANCLNSCVAVCRYAATNIFLA